MNRALAFMAVLFVALVAVGSAVPGTVPPWKAWLCFPGAADDWCSVGLTTTVVPADGSHRNLPVSVPTDPRVDCFYVYPTVSEEMRPNADLELQPEERDVAIAQAAYFSHVCRVYAPLYRQKTGPAGTCVAGLCVPAGNFQLGYRDVLAAWNDYLAHHNDGRGVVLIGHSQGARILEQLIQQQIERSPSERKLLISAILLGGEVTVADGSTRGGTFKTIPACTSETQTGCVIAYASWNRTPPTDAQGQNIGGDGQHILCVNPAAPAGGTAPITPVFAGKENPEGIAPATSIYATYLWVEFPHLYTAKCIHNRTRAWLLISRIHTRGDRRPSAQEVLGPSLGLHAADVNIALGNLVTLVASEKRAWLAHR